MATTELMAFTTGAFYVTGGGAAFLSTLPTWRDPAELALVSLAGAAVVVGGALLRWGRHLPRWTFHLVVGCASTMICAGVVLSETEASAMLVASVFVFCAVDILYFFHGRQALAQTLLLLAAATGGLGARGAEPAHLVALLMVLVAIIIVIGRLIARAAQGARDALTGLPNRRGLDERLERAVAEALRGLGAPLSVAAIDIDHFKAVNDRGGHVAGDALLQRLAGSWSAVLPPGVWLTRQGGDEFTLLARGLDAVALAELCAQLHALALPATISIGTAELGRGESGASLLHRADTALYAAKTAGRAHTSTAQVTDDRLAAELAAAIVAGDIEVVLAPIVSPGSGALRGVAPRVRWHHPTRGPIPPDVLIALARRAGLTTALAMTVALQGCARAEVLQQETGTQLLLVLDDANCAVTDTTATGRLLDALHAAAWPAEQLLVMTTSNARGSLNATSAAVLERGAGVGIATSDPDAAFAVLRDEGASWATSLILRPEMVSGCLATPRGTAALRALLALGSASGTIVIAQGVETVAQASLLDSMGCPLAQGPFFSSDSTSSHDTIRRSPSVQHGDSAEPRAHDIARA